MPTKKNPSYTQQKALDKINQLANAGYDISPSDRTVNIRFYTYTKPKIREQIFSLLQNSDFYILNIYRNDTDYSLIVEY